MEDTVNERLKILMKALDINVSTLARVLGISDSTVRNYVDRESKPGYEVLEKLYHSFKHINLYWLFGEPGDPLLPNETASSGTLSGNKKISRSLIVGNQSGGTATQNQGGDASKDVLIEQLRSQLADKDEIILLLKRQLPKP